MKAARILALAPCLLAGAAHADMQVTTKTPIVQVLECMHANTPDALTVDTVRIQSTGAEVRTPQLEGRLVAKRDEHKGLRVRLDITAPATLAGTRYLLIEGDPDDALYVYLPAIGKVRRVSGASGEGDIAGTGLGFADLRTLVQAIGGASMSLSAPDAVQGRPTDTLRIAPAIADAPWRRIILAVDHEHCVTLRAEFQDATGTARRYEATATSLKSAGHTWYAEQGVIEDLRRGIHSQLSLRGVSTDRAPGPALLDPKNLGR